MKVHCYLLSVCNSCVWVLIFIYLFFIYIQALRPFMVYYTFSMEALETLEKVIPFRLYIWYDVCTKSRLYFIDSGQVTKWIMLHKWNVGDLWNMVMEYSFQRSKRETGIGFFNWLLPLLSSHDPMMLDSPPQTVSKDLECK